MALKEFVNWEFILSIMSPVPEVDEHCVNRTAELLNIKLENSSTVPDSVANFRSK